MESTIKAQAQTIIELQELVASVDSVWGLIGCLKNGKWFTAGTESTAQKRLELVFSGGNKGRINRNRGVEKMKDLRDFETVKRVWGSEGWGWSGASSWTGRFLAVGTW